MNVGLESLASNLGMSFVNIITIVIVFGNLIFWAMKFELGNLMLMVVSGGVFAITYINGGNYTNFLVLTFISLVFMAFSLLFGQKVEGVVS